MFRSAHRAGLGLSVLAILLLSPYSWAQEQEGAFIETMDVNLVNVDVYVTDKKGKRVQGLTAEDFEIFEDGRPVTITNFYAMAEGRPAVETVPTMERPEVDLPPSQPEAAAPTIPDEQRLHLIVYIDNLHIRPFNRNKVLSQVRTFLRTKMKQDSQTMLVTFERALKVRLGVR